ncbi:hypothetical protein [Novosphingobium sp. JCM 18896]|uniref:hypothetical protein n=1 Tax=Novosphingobium sp. JCM 18896 TaxID=2989731 RepID=UPI0022227745|nr:hypothetical protein [Novosphingobium sp. JCM 18896]MCW1428539.1 hypothetical protein [Novosphingobium sp. JCM 18896]
MKQISLLDSLRVWAAVTGVLLALGYFGVLLAGGEPTQTLPMLVAAIGGFELFLYAQDLWLQRSRRHG